MAPALELADYEPELFELVLVLGHHDGLLSELLSKLGVLGAICDLVDVDGYHAFDPFVSLFDNLIDKLGLTDVFRLRY